MVAIATHGPHVHLGPLKLDRSIAFSQELADLGFHETGVRVYHRARKRWCDVKRWTLRGPTERLTEALELVRRFGAARLGRRVYEVGGPELELRKAFTQGYWACRTLRSPSVESVAFMQLSLIHI